MTSLEQAARALLESLEEWPHYSLDVKNAEKRLRAALDAEAKRVSVPIEPSEAMLDAGYRSEAEDGTPRDIWIAMLAAAQEDRDTRPYCLDR